MLALPLISPGPIALDLGFAQIRWYGLMTATACLLSFYLAEKILKERSSSFNVEEFSNFVLVGVITGLIGARTWFVLLNFSYFIENPMESFQIWLGGQSIQGAIAGATIGCYLYYSFFQRKKLSPEELNAKPYTLQLACIAIVSPLGQAIGRWGNFFNEEAFGSVTTMPWGLYISHTGNYHHPTFLYEMIWNILVFTLLRNFHLKFSNTQCIAAYIGLDSFGRLLIEPIRTDSLYIGSVKAASLIAITGILIGLVLFIKNQKLPPLVVSKKSLRKNDP